MYLNRSCLAFTFSCEKLALYNDKLYFWTWTFRQVPYNDDWAMWQYKQFIRKIQDEFPLIKGIRITELHRSHGIHFHALANERIPIERVKRIGWPHGFGRMSVERADVGSITYLAKYLTKQYRSENQFGSRRRWGTIGGFQPSRCRDIAYDTPCSRNHAAMFGAEQTDTWTAMLGRSYSDTWGECWQWPPFIRERYRDALEARQDKLELTPNQIHRLERLNLIRKIECPF